MISRDIFPKYNLKISNQNVNGNEIEVDIRENEEQLLKFQEIVDLLVAAGYFRARIKGLSPFDKVVGGMTWCIESCNIDVDVDLLFQENSTIGQKIALTEKIVAVLPEMKCPYNIEPHQIQGLDFIHIFPVIQWLVKTSMEFRQETFQLVRKNAINQFNKIFTLDEETETEKFYDKICVNVKNVRDAYRPRRQYRLKNIPPKNEFDRIQVTLLEYGYRGVSVSSSTTAAIDTDSKTLSKDQVTNEELEEKHVEVLFKALTEENEGDYDQILTLEEKKELQKHYAILQSEMEDGGIRSKEERKLAKLEAQKQFLEEHITKLKMKQTEFEEKIDKNSKSLKELRSMKEEAVARLNQFDEITKEKESDINKLETLVLLNENLKEQEILFKEQCRKELQKLQEMIENAKISVTKKPHTELEEKIEEARTKVQTLRLNLANQNRKIAAYQRQLDDIPTRSELAQYQRRFLELYNQVAAKHKETKQYFTLYNTLNDIKMYITKELSLLNSILDNYPEAVNSNSGKEEFLNELSRIVDSVKQTKYKVEAKFAEEQKRRDALSDQLQVLIAQQRKYVALVRQLSIECGYNETLNV